MSIELDGAVLRVSSSYGLKVGLPNYSSEDAHTSISVEVPVEGKDVGELVAQAVELERTLQDGVKMATINAVDQGFEITDDGIIRPVFNQQDIPNAAPKAAAPKAAPRSYAPFGGGGKAKGTTVTVDFGLGAQEYFDQRGKKASGEYKENAADFRSVKKNGERFHSVWLTGKDGTLNDEAVAALEAYGVD